jgi:Na+/H+-dicarboxylate symporter
MGVDRILDMSRTALNVTGDLVAAKVMDNWVGGSDYHEEVQRQSEHDAQRAQTGADVILNSDSKS